MQIYYVPGCSKLFTNIALWSPPNDPVRWAAQATLWAMHRLQGCVLAGRGAQSS